ncbi:DUF2382 domain-containing protein [Streptacidiphilus monticola]
MEERLDITKEWRVLGRARLRKYVTAEQVERRVPVVRERVRVERTPVSDQERAQLTEREIAEAIEEVTLHEERVTARKTVVPVERVRLVVERVTEEQVVREQLRREHIQIQNGEDPQPAGPGRPTEQAPATAKGREPDSPPPGRRGRWDHARPAAPAGRRRPGLRPLDRPALTPAHGGDTVRVPTAGTAGSLGPRPASSPSRPQAARLSATRPACADACSRGRHRPGAHRRDGGVAGTTPGQQPQPAAGGQGFGHSTGLR